MQRVRTIIVPMALLALLALRAFGVDRQSARADDFRVESAVYVGDQKDPSIETTTIFLGNEVYDFRNRPAETVVFDKIAGRITLLNPAHQKRAELTSTEVAAFADRLQRAAAKSNRPWVKFLAEPKFGEQFDESAGELTLSSPWVSYRLALSHDASPSIVEQYHDFSDWLARLNALLIPGSSPPFARLIVNAALAQRQAMAVRVVKTDTPDPAAPQPTVIRSEHRLVRPLAPADLERAAQARESIGRFALMGFDQYRKLELR